MAKAADITIDANTNIKDLVTRFPETARVFGEHGLPCVGCHIASYETIAQGAAAHSMALDPCSRTCGQ